LYGRLKGIRELVFNQSTTNQEVGKDYDNIVNDIAVVIGENLASFILPKNIYNLTRANRLCTTSDNIQGKLLQLLGYLEYGYALSEQVIEIGSVYNSIADEELKSRCSDILSAPSNFDRVINQATLVLEDRIRTKAKLDGSAIGVNLVNKALNPDPSKSILKVSDNTEEHEGICHICRGIVLAFRNPTHHKLNDQITREDALKVCAFVDKLLAIIEQAKTIASS
jgi:hypothetical protein